MCVAWLCVHMCVCACISVVAGGGGGGGAVCVQTYIHVYIYCSADHSQVVRSDAQHRGAFF